MCAGLRRELVWPVLVVAVALLFRLRLLGEIPLDYDEIATLVVARLPLAELGSALGTTHHVPPLSYLVLRAAEACGLSGGWLRLPSVLLGTASCWVLYAFARTTLGRGEAAVAASLLALSAFHIEQSRFARCYGLQSFLLLACTLSLWRALAHDRWRDWIATAASAVLALYTHYFSVFALLGLAILAGLDLPRLRDEGRTRRALVTALATATLAAPAGVLAGARFDATYVPFDVFEWSNVGLSFALATLRIAFRAVAAGAFTHEMAALSPARFLDPISLVAAALALHGAIQLARRNRRVFVWLLVLVALPLLGAIAAVAGRSFFAHRYALPALPGYLMLVAAGSLDVFERFTRGFGRRERRLTGAIAWGLCLVFLLGLDRRDAARLGILPSQALAVEMARPASGLWQRAAAAIDAAGLRAGDALLVSEVPGAASAESARRPLLLRWQAHNATLFHYHVRERSGLDMPVFLESAGFARSNDGQALLSSMIPPRGAWAFWGGTTRMERVWRAGYRLRADPVGYRTTWRARVETGREPGALQPLELRLLKRIEPAQPPATTGVSPPAA